MNSVMENKHEVVEMGETEGDGQSCLLCSIPTGMRQPFATSTRCTWYRPMERSIRYSRRP